MKAKRFTATVLAMSISMAPSVLLANDNTPNNTTKHHTDKDAYHNRDMDGMDAKDSAMINNRNYNKRSALSKDAKASKFMNKDVVKQVQEKLNDNNFTVGSADGIYGPKTRSALMDYQRSEDLEVTGRLNQETLDSLDIDSTYFGTERNMYSE